MSKKDTALEVGFISQATAQCPDWVNFTSGNNVTSFAEEGGDLWIASSGGGVVKLDKTSGQKTFFNSANSGLPGNELEAIATDGASNIWIGTRDKGLAKFDGTNWTVFNPSNSGIPDNWVSTVTIDGGGNKWIGAGRGLARFDGANWTVFDPSNSGLPWDVVLAITIDGTGNKWIGTVGGGLAAASQSVDTLSIKQCTPYTVPSGDETYDSSDTYMDTIPNSIGCDTILTINLTITDTIFSDSTTVSSCDSYTVPSGDETYDSSGTYMDTIPNSMGCDSILTIDVTVIEIDTTVTPVNPTTLEAVEPGVSYQWLDCDKGYAPISGAYDQQFTASSNGSYAVEVTKNGCTDTSECCTSLT